MESNQPSLNPELLKSLAQDKMISDTELLKHVQTLKQDLAKRDLFFLATQILGYKDLGAIHKPLCEVVQSINPLFEKLRDEARPEDLKGLSYRFNHASLPQHLRDYFQFHPQALQRLFLMFRGSFKTTLITIAHTIQLMLIYPDIRILIVSHKKEEGSQEILSAIKRHFMSNDLLRDLFPEYVPQASKSGSMEWGTSEKVTLPNRSSRASYPEATIEIAGATTDVTGRHYDVIKADDLVTKDSVTNETMIQKTRQMFSLLKFLFNQPEWGLLDIIGTPYHFNDLYAGLRRTSQLTSVIIPAVGHAGVPTFSERFSPEGLDRIKRDPSMGSYEFSCQYMLNPVPVEDQTFRPEWFEQLGFYYHELPRNLRFYMFVDPANKRTRKSDYTAIMVIGIDDKGKMYLCDAIRDKLSVEDRTNVVIEIAKKRGLTRIFYEAVGFQDTDRYIIKKKSQDTGYYLNVVPIKATNTSKEDRIRGLQPLYERGMISWPKKYNYYSKYDRRTVNTIELLKDEMLMFPRLEHDDMIDCHAFLLQVTTSKAEKEKPQVPDDNFGWWRQQAINAKKKRPIATLFGINGKRKPLREIPAKKSWK